MSPSLSHGSLLFKSRVLLLRVDYTFTKRDTLLLRASALVYPNRPMDFFLHRQNV